MTPAEIPREDASTLLDANLTRRGKKTKAAPTDVDAPAAIMAPNAMPTLELESESLIVPNCGFFLCGEKERWWL